MAKAVIGLSFVLVLMFVGFRGRHHARLQARLDDITRIRDQLQQKLDDQHLLEGRIFDGARGTNAIGIPRPTSNPQVRALVSALKARLEQFESDYSASNLADVEHLEFRLSQATLANAELRFADGLARITDADEQGNRADTEARIRRRARVLQVRGDSFFGRQEWQNAALRYQQLLTLQPHRLLARARLADSQSALGKHEEAVLAYHELAKSYTARGEALVTQKKPAGAIGSYKKAVEIYTRLIEQEGGTNFIPYLQAVQVQVEKLLADEPRRGH